MKHRVLFTLTFALALVLFLCACAPNRADAVTKYTSEGMTLPVPNKYVDLLVIETADSSGSDGILFSVHEKASLEAAKEIAPDDKGGGLLFSIVRVTEEFFLDMVCQDMIGADVFALDEDGNYYIFYSPTDVQLIRTGEYTEADWEQWDQLFDWACGMTESFLAENPVLTPYSCTYTTVDMALYRILHLQHEVTLSSYDDDTAHISTHEQSVPFVERLLDNANFFFSTDDFFPVGPYISLHYPNSGWRFDFFTEEGQKHYIRQISPDETTASMLFADCNGVPYPVSDIVADWLTAVS